MTPFASWRSAIFRVTLDVEVTIHKPWHYRLPAEIDVFSITGDRKVGADGADSLTGDHDFCVPQRGFSSSIYEDKVLQDDGS